MARNVQAVTMDDVRREVRLVLPELGDDDVIRLMDKLKELGVDSLDDMAGLEEGDLVPPLKKLKERKLIKVLGNQSQGDQKHVEDLEDDFEVIDQPTACNVNSLLRGDEEVIRQPTASSVNSLPRGGDEGDVNKVTRWTDDVNMSHDLRQHSPGKAPALMPTWMKPCYRLLLLGKTGEGKSATGNSILGRKHFKSNADTKSVTTNINAAYCDRGSYLFKVIDGPGTGDTRLNKQKALEKANKDLGIAMEKCTAGFHAIVMVYAFGHRFTIEDQDSIDLIKKILGSNVFKLFGICVITGGDRFRDTMEDEGTPEMSIDQWCRKQAEQSKEDEFIKFSSLLNECENRIVLFNNRAKNEVEQNAQIHHLLQSIAKLSSKGKLYTSDQFQAMAKERKRLIIQGQLPQMEEMIQAKCSLIQESLGKICLKEPNAESKMNELKIKSDELIEEIDNKDAGTGVLQTLKRNVHFVMDTIKKVEETKRQMKEKYQQILKETRMRELEAEKEAERIRYEYEQRKIKEEENQRLFEKKGRELEAEKVGERNTLEQVQKEWKEKNETEREADRIRNEQAQKEMKKRESQLDHESKMKELEAEIDIKLESLQKQMDKNHQDFNATCKQLEQSAENKGFFETMANVFLPKAWSLVKSWIFK